MIKIGITGQSGFIATHLINRLGLEKENYIIVPFDRTYFNRQDRLNKFVSSCDVLVHLAALNRHSDAETIYNTNISLVEKLIAACKETGARPHIIFSSSTQEERDNHYGRSKREGRELFAKWAEEEGALFTGMIIPNVFGPFGKPYYNSVVATFSHQLTHDEEPVIDVDGELKMIYVGELAEEMLKIIEQKKSSPALPIKHTSQIKVSALLDLLENFKAKYIRQGIFPVLQNKFEVNLFNTFLCFMDLGSHFPVKFITHSDQRGSFAETVKAEISGQTSFSITRPGVTRGNHFHTRKIERFAVIKGEAEIGLRRIGTDRVFKFKLSGGEPAYVDMPIWYTHNITNTGSGDLYTLFWINEFYDPQDPDTYHEEV